LWIRQSLKLGDSIAKTADSFSLATDKLRALQFAATLGGIENEQLNKSIKRMLISAGDLAQGLTEAKKAYDSLGLSMEDVIRLSNDPFEMFIAISEALKGIGSNAERAAVLNDIFGRQGLAMLNVLRFTRKEFEDILKFVRRVGTGMERIEFAKFERLNDALSTAKELFKGIGFQITKVVAPVLAEVTERLVAWVTGTTAVGDATKFLVDGIVLEFATALDVIDQMRSKWLDLRSAIDSSRGSIALFTGQFAKAAGIFESSNAFTEQAKAIRQQESNLDRYAKKLDALWTRIKEQAEAIAAQRQKERQGLGLLGDTSTIDKLTSVRAAKFGFKTARELGFDPRQRAAITATNNIPQQQLDEARKLNQQIRQFLAGAVIAA